VEESGASSGVILQEAIPESLHRWTMVFLQVEKDAPAFPLETLIWYTWLVTMHFLSDNSVMLAVLLVVRRTVYAIVGRK